MIALSTGLLSVGNCAECSAPNKIVARCFTDNHLTSVISSNAPLPWMRFSYLNEQLCQQQEDAVKAIGCIFQFLIDCVFGMASYQPPVSNAHDVVTMTCKQFKNIDLTCVNNQSVQIVACANPRRNETAPSSPSEVNKMICKYFEATYTCLRPHLEPCGCATYGVLHDVYRGPTWPAPCSRPQVDTYRCDPKNPNLFLDVEDSGSQTMPSVLLLFTLAHLMLLGLE